MKLLKKILFVVLGIIALILITALIAPKEFSGQSEITIQKPKQEVYNYIKFLKNQENYGIWHRLDPNMKVREEGVDGMVGFTYKWQSDNRMVGNGRQVITKLIEGESMESALYIEDFEEPAKSLITLTEQSPNQTLVQWQVVGKSPYPFNIMNLFFNMDKDFETGLINLKNNQA